MNPFREPSESRPSFFKLTIAIFAGVFLALVLFCGLLVWAYIALQLRNEQLQIERESEKIAKQQRFSDELRKMINREADKATAS